MSMSVTLNESSFNESTFTIIVHMYTTSTRLCACRLYFLSEYEVYESESTLCVLIAAAFTLSVTL